MAGLDTIIKGVKFVAGVAEAAGIFGGKGTPGAPPAPSLVSQKPYLNLQRRKISLGLGAGEAAGLGGFRMTAPYPSKESEWVSLQKRYLTYLNMAEAFEDPGKVRRAIKLKVS